MAYLLWFVAGMFVGVCLMLAVAAGAQWMDRYLDGEMK